MRVTITLRAAKIIAELIDLFPVTDMSPETQQAVIEFLSQIRKAEQYEKQ
jgi:hypothetical protein